MRGLWQDIRYAGRVLRAHPGAVLVAVISLAIGVGVHAVVFSLVDAMFLRPLPVADPGGLVRIEWQSADGRPSALAWTEVETLRTDGGAFADVAAQNRRGGLLDTGGGDLELTLLTIVSDNYFPLLGLPAQHGRLFRQDLDEALRDGPAVVITDGLWRRRFGGDPAVVGRSLRLNGRPFTVVGILPPAFRGLQRAAAAELWVPMSASGGGATRDVVIPGRQAPAGQEVLRVRYNQISPDYLAVAGTTLLAGRAFSRADGPDTLKVAIVNDTMARQFWPDKAAVGSWITVDGTSVQIVGVAENAAVNNLHEPPQPFLYVPFAQYPSGEVTFIFEAARDPGPLVPAVKRAMRAADPDHALLMTTTLRQHMRDALYQDWLQAVLSAVVAAIGVALAAVGLMGIVTHAVTRRRREIGVRTALGARRSDVVGLVLRDTLVWSGAGALAGVGASLALGRAMSGLLFGVSPFDPAVLSAAVGLVLIVALCGSAYPAWRAARVDPVEVLRED